MTETCQNFNELSDLHDALTGFEQVSDAVYCAFTSDAGLGIGPALFGLFVFGSLGMGLTIRTQHIGPVLVSGILCAGLIAASLPGRGARIFALLLFIGITGLGLWIYSRAKTEL